MIALSLICPYKANDYPEKCKLQAANGIANLTVAAMVSEGLTMEQAQDRVYMFDVEGLLSTRREGGVPEHAKAFGKNVAPEKSFEACIAKIKPSCLIGK